MSQKHQDEPKDQCQISNPFAFAAGEARVWACQLSG